MEAKICCCSFLLQKFWNNCLQFWLYFWSGWGEGATAEIKCQKTFKEGWGKRFNSIFSSLMFKCFRLQLPNPQPTKSLAVKVRVILGWSSGKNQQDDGWSIGIHNSFLLHVCHIPAAICLPLPTLLVNTDWKLQELSFLSEEYTANLNSKTRCWTNKMISLST